MAQNNPNTFLLIGTIYDEYNAPLVNVKVKAFDKDLRTEHLLGEAVTNKKGQYLIRYNKSKFSWAEKASADVFIRVFKNTPRDKKEIGTSPVFFNVPAEFTLDFKIDGTPYTGLSEFDTLVNTIAPLLKRQRVTMANLKEDEKFKDISFLSAETGVDASIISLLPAAFKHNEATKNNIPPDIFYGLFRLQFPIKLNELLLIKSETLINGINEAIKKNIISSKWEKQIDSFIKKLNELSTHLILSGKEEDNVAFKAMIATTLPKEKLQKTFIDTFLTHESEPEKFWKELSKKDGFTDGKLIAETKSVLRLNLLTNQPILAAHLYKLQARDPELKEIRGYAKLTKKDFGGHINKIVSSGKMKSFPDGIEGKTPEEKTNNYAGALEDLVRELYPTDVFRNRISKDASQPFGVSKDDLLTFLTKNQDFDLSTTKINALLKESDLSGIRDKNSLKNELKKINRVYKLSPNYETSSVILNAGLNSASAIVKQGKKAFVKKFEGQLSAAKANEIYNKAQRVDNITTVLAAGETMQKGIPTMAINGLSPNNQSMFGDVNLCDCLHCQSVYSPSAYLVDMLNFMQLEEGEDGEAFKEFIDRRPDVKHILLTCKNTNTPVPYIDLVNEILENQVVNNALPAGPNDVPQTNNTAEELIAFPEHEIADAYTILSNAFSSFELPLNLPLEKTRIYLDKLNCNRHELMELFYGKRGDSKYTDISIATEYLGISENELKVINGQNSNAVAAVPGNKVGDFLDQTGLSYIQLLQLLECHYINPIIPAEDVRTITIEADELDEDGKDLNPATCDIKYLNLEGLTNSTAKQMLRIIRLWKKLECEIFDLDRIFISLAIDPDDTASEFNKKLIIPLSHIFRIKSFYKLSIPQILSLWSDLPTTTYFNTSKAGEADITSLYDNLFQNKQISNPVDDSLGDPSMVFDPISDKSSIITAACNISDADFNLLNQTLVNQIPIIDDQATLLKNLSAFYRYSNLAKMLHLKVEEVLLLIDLTGITPLGDSNNSKDVLLFIDMYHLIRSVGLSLPEFSRLIQSNPDDKSQTNPNVIEEVLTALREGLQKTEALFPTPLDAIAEENKLVAQKALIIDSLSTAFNTESKIIKVLLEGMVRFTADNSEAAFFPFLDVNFINGIAPVVSQGAGGETIWLNDIVDLVDTYNVINETLNRLSLLLEKLSISVDEFVYLQKKESALGLDEIWNLPNSNIDAGLFGSFERLIYLLQFRDNLAQPKEDWFTIFDHANKNDFFEAFTLLTAIPREALVLLEDTDQLNLTFPENYFEGKLLLNIIACVNKAKQLGSTAQNLFELTKPALSNTEAELAKGILKARYDEVAWLEIIKPISNQLREKKRNALVSYLLTASETESFRINKHIINSDDLVAHFLIDTQMGACMITSRIKQAISSMQLFIDRCLMELENIKSVGQNFSDQWDKWRKVYRIWEANRKIFLYPENWIEPDLRDDKSPFFKELEAKLTQNEVTDDIAKDAILEYLEKLDMVANLEIIAFFPDELTGINHVLGRTKNIPHQYFYRKQEKSVWTAWEKVELDIQGDHILLVIWNNRLMVYWGEFTEKQKENKDGVIFTQGESDITSEKPEKYLEMRLNWSEYKNEKWGAKKMSEESIELANKTILLSSIFIEQKLAIIIYEAQNYSDPPLTYFLYLNKGFCFDNCDDAPIIKSGILVFHLFGIKGVNQSKMFLEERSIDSFSIYKTGLLNPVEGNSDIKLFNNTPGKYKILPNLHEIELPNIPEIEKNKPVKFIYHDEQSVFYAQSFRVLKIQKDEFDMDILPPRMALTRSFVEPDSDSPFINGASAETFNPNGNSSAFNNVSTGAPQDAEHPPLPIVPHSNFNKKKYKFQTFYHPFVCEYIEVLNTDGIGALYHEDIQNRNDSELFTAEKYNPNVNNVLKKYPVETVDFEYSGAYSIYNWELFFHIPLLIASRLSQNQKFAEARKWFHYIFDPTKPSNDEPGSERFWITKPFKKEIENQVLSMEDLLNDSINQSELTIQLEHWQDHPFNTHAVARLRHSAYMRSTLMKYIDNLTAWGDQLFRRDSIESINEATLLYVLAANLLGKKLENIPSRTKQEDTTFENIKDELGPFSNTKEAIESFLSPNDNGDNGSSESPVDMPFFCMPKNKKLLGYWDTIADKLFNIRHCMNIEGEVRELKLFEPVIDPALLVRAAAAGLDLNTVLNDLSAKLPNYRFQMMLQKANELCNDVKSLGSQLLSTLEKKDAEALSLLRSGHEIKLLELVKDIKTRQIEEAKEQHMSLLATQNVTKERKSYYDSREFMNDKENQYSKSSNQGLIYQVFQAEAALVANLSQLVPDVKVGAGTTFGATYGGSNIGPAAQIIASRFGTMANIENWNGNQANIQAGYVRRMDDWQFQVKTAELELKQIEKSLIASEIRLNIAIKELNNHEVQMEQSKTIEAYMRSKFTNAELYNYMITQLSGIYFQTYQMAYDLAKKAERCYQFELGIKDSNLIKFGHWDSLKKGLLSGEKLQFDLRRLENAYLEENKREFEIVKHVSISMLDPLALVQLRATGKCEFTIPEVLYDMDHPGHYMRRLKSVSVSMPCIAGPYTSVSASLKLTASQCRVHKDLSAESLKQFGKDHAIATSNAQNDSGVFELNFKDERYLPFEGAGAISRWQLELPSEIKQFNYNTISDVVLHVKYTAREANELKNEVNNSLKEMLNNITQQLDEQGLHIPINMKHDLSNEWHQLKTNDQVGLKINKSRLPYMVQPFDTTKIESVMLVAKIKDNPAEFTINVDGAATKLSKVDELKLYKGVVNSDIDLDTLFTLSVSNADKLKLEELVLIVKFKF